MNARRITLLVLASFLLILLLQNLPGASVGFLFWDLRVPLSILLVAFYALGALTARPLHRLIRRMLDGA